MGRNLRREKGRVRDGPGFSHYAQPMVILEFNTVSFLRNVIVPGFKALTFLSKKAKDFSDWSLCVEVYFTGHHTLQE